MASTTGAPTLMSEPSWTSRTRSSFTDEPGSAARRSTSILSPGATRYCLPPLTTTADSDPSGLGTNGDITGPRGPLAVLQQGTAKHDRLDQSEGCERRHRRRASVGDERQRDARDR